jgi:UDP-N-acetylglucosamine diphosphorylase/glucosamine-1-phosphate N-acetyltransferase
MDIYLFKNRKVESFYPLHFFKNLSDIRIGILTNSKRYGILYNSEPAYLIKLDDILGKGIYIDETFISYTKLSFKQNTILLKDGEIVGYYILNKTAYNKINIKSEIEGIKLEYAYSIIKYNLEIIKKDYILLNKEYTHNTTDNLILYGEKRNLFICKTVKINGKIIFNTENGPIYIDDNVIFNGFNHIEGPCYIGKDTIVDSVKIRPGCTFGKGNRISGEIEESIFMDYVNKHHIGFIGHSIIGNWVNLGALTTNSDLKNNYHNVRLTIEEKTIDTGMLKMGCIIGDFSKTGIGTLINTGTITGVSCNIFGGNLTEKFYPSFSWKNSTIMYDIEKAIDTISITMKRRDVTLEKNTENTLREIIKKERNNNGDQKLS